LRVRTLAPCSESKRRMLRVFHDKVQAFGPGFDAAGRPSGSIREHIDEIVAIHLAVLVGSEPPRPQSAHHSRSTTSTEQSGRSLPASAVLERRRARREGRRRGDRPGLESVRRGDADAGFVHDGQPKKVQSEGQGVKRSRHVTTIRPRRVRRPIRRNRRRQGRRRRAGKIARASAVHLAGRIPRQHEEELRLWQRPASLSPIAEDSGRVETVRAWVRRYHGVVVERLSAYRTAAPGFVQDRGDLAILTRRRGVQPGTASCGESASSNVEGAGGQAFIEWIISPKGRRSRRTRSAARQLFFPKRVPLKHANSRDR